MEPGAIVGNDYVVKSGLKAGDAVITGPYNSVRGMADGDLVKVDNHETLPVGRLTLTFLHTPGHTPGSSCFRTEGLLFSGDLVFRGAIGRYDFPNSSAEDMWASLGRFLALPDDVDVYPGHGDTTTVELERRTNPFLVNLA